MKHYLFKIMLFFIVLSLPTSISAIQLELHGRMDHRFQMYTNQNAWFVLSRKVESVIKILKIPLGR